MAKITGYRKIFINLGIILFFIVLAYAYLSPLVEGKILKMPDIEHFSGMSKELVDYRNETGDEALWTNRMFGGMPAYLISTLYPGNWADFFAGNMRKIFSVASFIILYLLGFYTLLSSLGFNRWLSVVGSIAFGFSSYFLIIIGAGHTSKANAIGYLAPVIAGVLLAFRGKPLAGGLLFAAALSLEILAGHMQITYYGFLLIGIYVIVQLVYSIKEKDLSSYFRAVLYLAAGAIIGVGMNFSRLYTTWEYSKDTIRGPSELTSDNANQTSGLDKDYVVQWSQGIDETMTLLIPNFMGGSTSTNPTVKGETYQLLRDNNVQNPREALKSIILYHGEKPGTAGPYYFGAIVVFLFVLGLFIVKGPFKWWLLIAAVVSVLMAWGKNFMGLTSFLLDYLPMYNKFRAPEMTLVIAAFAFPLLGFLTLHQITTGKVDKKNFQKGMLWAFLLTGGISLLLFAAPGMSGNFSAPFDVNYPDWLLPGILADREKLLKTDAIRSFAFILAGAGLIYLWRLKKIKNNLLYIGLGFFILIDLWSVDKRFLNNDNFVAKREAENPFPLTPADEAILKDKNLSFRVLPLQNPFQDARASYYHKNVGGYHAAKLRRYDELIEHRLIPEINTMINQFQSTASPDSVFAPLSSINMMNSKYIIYDLNSTPLVNPNALGNAWFVSRFSVVENADEEIRALDKFDPSEVAVVDKRVAGFVEGKNFQKDKNGFVRLTEYQPNYLKYESKAATEQLTVFSEIFYEKGWNAFVDGEKVPHFRVNYVLRAMVLPSGEHTVEFRFEPKSYYMGNKISLASSFIFMLLLLGFVYVEIRKKINSEKFQEDDKVTFQ